jgi:hypothetical protein
MILKSAMGVANLANAEEAENHMFKFSNMLLPQHCQDANLLSAGAFLFQL